MLAKNKYKITIITATYNSAATLEQTIASVARQDYPDIEYIIVDGASTDGTLEIVRKYEDKINLKWISEPDNGIYDAFNKGIDMATGEYIQFLGSDDSLCNAHAISCIAEQIEANTDILSATIVVIDEKSKKQYIQYNHLARNKKEYLGGMIPHPGMFVKTSLGRKYKFDTSYKILGDYKFFLQCYYDDNVKFKFIDEPVVFFTNSGTSSDIIKCWKEDNRIYAELGLPFHEPAIYSRSPVKRVVRRILHKMGMLVSVQKAFEIWKYRYKIHFVWQNHSCDNPICRWCGRGLLIK